MIFIKKHNFDQAVEKEAEKKIQAMGEGGIGTSELESLMASFMTSDSGLDNPYRSYEAQVLATYQKYNGQAELGNWITRAIIDTRTGFISGEGLSVITKDEKLGKFLDDVMVSNRLKGSRFHNLIKAGEMEGRQLITTSFDEKTKKIKILAKNSNFASGINYKVYLNDSTDVTDIKKVTEIKADGTESEIKGDFTYVKIGGDHSKVMETTTRTGVVLQQIDNFSRGLNVMRKNNHLFARVTPFFKTETQKDANTLLNSIKQTGWKVGTAFAGPADMKMLVPDVGAMGNIQAELLSLTKAIAAITGIPIHWFGYVDAMSNRSVADNLFEAINNATIQERSLWSESFFEIFLKVQQIGIDNGIYSGAVSTDFEVKIPLVSFAKSVELVANLSLAYHDGAISLGDYQNSLPGIDPYKTNIFIAAERKSNPDKLINPVETPETKEKEV